MLPTVLQPGPGLQYYSYCAWKGDGVGMQLTMIAPPAFIWIFAG